MRFMWSQWRREAFAGGAANDRAVKQQEAEDRARVEKAKDKEISEWTARAEKGKRSCALRQAQLRLCACALKRLNSVG